MASVPVLARLIARPLEALAERLPGALEGDPHHIHQARVASRRLRELLPIVSDVLKRRPQRRLRRRLRSLTRALGPVREVDVELASIDEMVADCATPLPLADEVKRDLVRARGERLAALTERFDAGRVRRLLRRLHRLESVLAEGEQPREWRVTLARRVARRAEALNEAVADAGALFDSDRLHTVRIAVKKLRYTLEVVGEARLAATGSMVRSLKEAQDILGKLHDADVLLAEVRAHAAAHVSTPLAAPSDVDASWFDREITTETRRLHARYLRRQTRLVRLADTALDSLAARLEARQA
jgi:CHAD domain-containing protein